MIKSRQFYKTFTILTLSLALQSLLSYSVNLMDNVMLGAYSETALSGSALCNQYQFLLQMLVLGIGEGIVVLGSQYWGKGELNPITQIIGIALRYAVAVSLVLFLLVFTFPSQALGLLTDDTAVVAEGVKYLQIICFSYILFAITNILIASMRTVGVVKIGYTISGSTFCINAVLNYCLIYGNLGFPRLGIRGSAIATLFSRTIELIIVICYLKYREHNLRLNLQKLIHIDKSYFRDFRKITIPVLLNQAQWGVAQMVQTGILGHMGSASIAANSIATIVFQIVSVIAYGSASASAILIGKTIGAGKEENLHSIVRTMQVLFIGIGLLTGLGIFLVKTPVLMLYNISPESHALAEKFILIMAITTIGTAYQVPCDCGIIRGGGDTAFSMKLNLISMWLIIVPLSAIAAFVLNWSPVVVFFLLKWDQLYKALPVTIRLNSWKWIRHITRPSQNAVTNTE
jgi:putative MATE family efflux protein